MEKSNLLGKKILLLIIGILMGGAFLFAQKPKIAASNGDGHFKYNNNSAEGADEGCAVCAPKGWRIDLGTPDMSNKYKVAKSGHGSKTSGSNSDWESKPLDLPPNNHQKWLTLRDLGPNGTEENVSTEITRLKKGRVYEVIVYSLTDRTIQTPESSYGVNYATVYNDKFTFSVDKTAYADRKEVDLKHDRGTWGTHRLRFVATGPTARLYLFPGHNSGGSGSYECVNISVTLNAVNDVPVANDDIIDEHNNFTTVTDYDILNNDTDINFDTGEGLQNGTVDLDPETPGQQKTITTPAGKWTVNNEGKLTFVPDKSYTGIYA